MLKTVTSSLNWLLDGMCEAVIAVVARLHRQPTYRINLGNRTVIDADGAPLGRMIDADATLQFDPPGLTAQLTGAAIDVELPQAWIWRRSLQPIGVDSLAYLDAFVAHHIERISPWRAADVYYEVSNRPIADDPTRLAVDVSVVPRQIVDHLVTALKPLTTRLRLVSVDDQNALAISLGAGDGAQRRSVRYLVSAILVVVGIAMAAWLVGLQWGMADLDAELADVDQQITARKAQLAAMRGGSTPGAGEALLAQRAARPYLVELVDALSDILPDHAYLVDLRYEKGAIRISGMSSRTSELVPALERSGRFADVKFAAATTRLEDGRNDRFHLEMRAAGDTTDAAP